ncbi:hypothetical protein HY635_02595 [Candidatus Uhrbacteria bacterium]|nr:hypothetical protein [Candidatus Uhrbacteria bacterium]
MATKDLGRTPLEAGNTTEYHETRREVRRRYRHEAKAFCRVAARNPELADEAPAPVAPEHRRPNGCWQVDMHDDRIGPVKRWIHSKVGRRWDDVYSEIRRTFDVRTLAGRHIVEQHLLQYVDIHGNQSYSDLIVDDDGVLRVRDDGRRHYCVARCPVSEQALNRWLAGRKVGRRSSRLFWFVSTLGFRVVKETRTETKFERNGRKLNIHHIPVEVPITLSAYRQDRPLTSTEIAFYERLPSWKQAEIAKDLAIEAVASDASQRPYRSPFYRQPTPGAPPLTIDEDA